MPQSIDRAAVRRLMEPWCPAQLVEVLPVEEYREDHLPGAISLPLRRLEVEARRRLDPHRPVVVYCLDSTCDLGPRAAWRLERFGFAPVYDYAAGQARLAGSRPPSEGTNALRPRAGGAAPADLPTCSLADRLADVRDRVRAAAGMPGSPSTSSGAPRSSGRARLADRAGHAPSGRARCSRSSRSRRSRGSWSNTTWGTAPITTSQGQLVGLLRRQAVLRVVADLQPDQPDRTDNRAQP